LTEKPGANKMMHASRGLRYVLIGLLMTSFPTNLNGKRFDSEEKRKLVSLEFSNSFHFWGQ